MDLELLAIAVIALIFFILTFVCPDKFVKADSPEKQKKTLKFLRICELTIFIAGLVVAFLKG